VVALNDYGLILLERAGSNVNHGHMVQNQRIWRRLLRRQPHWCEKQHQRKKREHDGSAAEAIHAPKL
jgi:hypothetical protein